MQFNWVKILLIGASITIVATIILQLITPSTPSPVIVQSAASKKNVDGSFSSFSGLNYTGQLPSSSPKSLPLVSLQLSDAQIQEVVGRLVKEHQLTQNPESATVWTSQKYLFSKNTNNSEYILSMRAPSEPFQNTDVLDQNQMEKIAEVYLNDTLQITNLKLLPEKTAFFKIETPHLEDSTPQLADVVQFSYSWTIEGIPVYLPNKFQASFVITINKNNEIRKLSFPLTIPTFEPATVNAPLISIPAAMQQLNSGNGSILNADLVNATSFDAAQITSGNLNRVSLEYRVDPELNLAVPYYRFEGLIKNKQGATYQAQLITPAVASAPQ